MSDKTCTYHYTIVEGQYTEEGVPYTGYGIAVTSPKKKGTTSLPNISLHRESVAELIERCNTLQLDPIHLWDVINDFLIENS